MFNLYDKKDERCQIRNFKNVIYELVMKII